MKRALVFIGAGALAFVAGVVTLARWVDRMTQRGLDADANGTAGYTTTGDLIQGGLGLALLLGGVALTVWGLVRWVRGRQSTAVPT